MKEILLLPSTFCLSYRKKVGSSNEPGSEPRITSTVIKKKMISYHFHPALSRYTPQLWVLEFLLLEGGECAGGGGWWWWCGGGGGVVEVRLCRRPGFTCRYASPRGLVILRSLVGGAWVLVLFLCPF